MHDLTQNRYYQTKISHYSNNVSKTITAYHYAVKSWINLGDESFQIKSPTKARLKSCDLVWLGLYWRIYHNGDVIMSTMASHIASLSIVCWSVCSGADQTKHQSSASLAFVRGIHRRPVNSPHKGTVTRKTFPFDDVIMCITWSRWVRPIHGINHGDYTLKYICIFITRHWDGIGIWKAVS